jgi:hypothetical protein
MFLLIFLDLIKAHICRFWGNMRIVIDFDLTWVMLAFASTEEKVSHWGLMSFFYIPSAVEQLVIKDSGIPHCGPKCILCKASLHIPHSTLHTIQPHNLSLCLLPLLLHPHTPKCTPIPHPITLLAHSFNYFFVIFSSYVKSNGGGWRSHLLWTIN